MKECKMSHSRDWKSYPARGSVKKIYAGGGKNVPVLTAGWSILDNGIF
jgi:hypothetical protein